MFRLFEIMKSMKSSNSERLMTVRQHMKNRSSYFCDLRRSSTFLFIPDASPDDYLHFSFHSGDNNRKNVNGKVGLIRFSKFSYRLILIVIPYQNKVHVNRPLDRLNGTQSLIKEGNNIRLQKMADEWRDTWSEW